MTETQLRRLNRMTVVIADICLGGGLVLGALTLFVIRLAPLTYSQRIMTFRVVSGIGSLLMLLVIGCAIVARRKGLTAVQNLVGAAGVVAFASLFVQIGIFARWDPVVLFVLTGIGIAVLAAALAIWRGRAWGGYLQIALAAAPAAFFFYLAVVERAAILALFGCVLLLVPFAFLDFRVSRRIFITLVIFILAGSMLMLSVGSANVVTASERTRQKRSLADMRTIATAVEAYATDHNAYPTARGITELRRLLEPVHIKSLPREDGWGHPFDYARVILPSREEGYVIRAAGADGVFEQKDPTAYAGGEVQGFERDLVFSTLSPSQWPEGQMGP